MKFKEEVCGNCSLDLTTAEPVRVREMPLEGEMVFLGECPKCHTNRIVVAPELAISPTPELEAPPVVEPAPEPEPEPEPEPAPEPEE